MNEAIRQMLERYTCKTQDDAVNALREILQQIALLGLWRGKFFEHAAFYGGTALRVLYGLDRYSEDLDFSLLESSDTFTLDAYGSALRREIGSFGFEVSFEVRRKTAATAIESAFLKANTLRQLIVIQAMTSALPGNQALKIKLEVDTEPPPGFLTESRPVLLPTPFAVRVYSRPDLFAGKMHALLCRKWKSRTKGRDWYDLVWYAGHYPQVRLRHLEARLRASGDWVGASPFTGIDLHDRLRAAIDALDVGQAREEAGRFVRDPSALELWSPEFFHAVAEKILFV